MKTKFPNDALPDFNEIYRITRDYISKHCSDDSYISLDAFDKSNEKHYGNDTIYGIQYDNELECGVEVIVYGVRIRNNHIEILTSPYCKKGRIAPSKKEYEDDKYWRSLLYDDEIYFNYTLLSLAEFIEEYE